MTDIEKLAELLSNNDFTGIEPAILISSPEGFSRYAVSVETIKKLWRAARDGEDISLAIPALAKALSNPMLMKEAASAMKLAAAAGSDISIVIPKLTDMVDSGDLQSRTVALEIFKEADVEQSAAMVARIEKIHEKDPWIDGFHLSYEEIAYMLVKHYVHKRNWDRLDRLLNSGCPFISEYSAEVLGDGVHGKLVTNPVIDSLATDVKFGRIQPHELPNSVLTRVTQYLSIMGPGLERPEPDTLKENVLDKGFRAPGKKIISDDRGPGRKSIV